MNVLDCIGNGSVQFAARQEFEEDWMSELELARYIQSKGPSDFHRICGTLLSTKLLVAIVVQSGPRFTKSFGQAM